MQLANSEFMLTRIVVYDIMYLFIYFYVMSICSVDVEYILVFVYIKLYTIHTYENAFTCTNIFKTSIQVQ